MQKYLVIILLLLIILIIIKCKNNSNVIQENFYTGNINNIWMYWENLPGKKKSPYLDLCYKTIKKNCSENFKIHLLNEKNVYYYIPDLRKNIDHQMNIQQKVDYIRYILLYKYGGIWIDADTIVIKDLTPIINKLKKYDFVGFGCHFNNREKC